MSNGLVIKSISGEYTVIDEQKRIHICKPRGVFRHKDIVPKVGDYVEIDVKNRYILKVKERKNDFIRPFIANVDKVFLLFSVKQPELNLNLLDRMISVFEYADLEIIIVFTKVDLFHEENQDEIKGYQYIRDYYRNLGYKIYETKKRHPDNNQIIEEIKGCICCFAGQSGVGKSTLLNHFDQELSIKTNEISRALGRGKHTTRHVELLEMHGGWIADTPGFGIVDFEMEDVATLSHSFVEFFSLSDGCKFRGCTHVNEPGCKVKSAVAENKILKSRYDNYLLFVAEMNGKEKNKY